MDVRGIKQYLIDNPDKIPILLEKAGFHHIDSRPDEYRCARDYDTNPTSIRVLKDSLASTCFSTNVSGDIITLIEEKQGLKFRETLKFITSSLGLDDGDYEKKYESYLLMDILKRLAIQTIVQR